jgi:phenylacetic acid degradation operon negative regulatory protein
VKTDAFPPSTTHLAADDFLMGDTQAAVIGARFMRPPQLLLTLLGEYWWQQNEPIPSAALVTLLTVFGVSDTAARAALSQLVHRDLLVTSKRGRQTFYRLSERATRVLNNGAQRIFSFGLPVCSWDGVWSLVAFSIPEENRRLRYVLRDRLRWLGFAPLYDGMWISPHDRLSEVASQFAELSIRTTTIFRAQIVSSTSEAGLPQQAWDLDALRSQYQQLIDMLLPLGNRIKNGMVSPEEALKGRTRLISIWQGFLATDPDLPDEILPPDWPRTQARQLFIEAYDELGPLAQHRVRQILALYAPDLASSATYHSSSAVLLIVST